MEASGALASDLPLQGSWAASACDHHVWLYLTQVGLR